MKKRPPLKIRHLKQLDDLRGCERLQIEVWGFADLEVVPYRLMAVMIKNGAIVLGAFRKKALVGFAFGFPGIRDGHPIFCSHMLAVSPAERERGIGYRLKLRQRREILRRDVDLVSWTFDPIEARNAYLNIGKLGCVSWEYWVNLYGKTTSPLHRGLDTDRLVARWYIHSRRTRGRLATISHGDEALDDTVPVHDPRTTPAGVLAPGVPRMDLDAPRLSFEIPADTRRLRTEALPIARRWQKTIRGVLQHYFGQGYSASDFVTIVDRGERRAFYILEQIPREEFETG